MKTCFPAMRGRRLGRRGYLLGDVMLVLLLGAVLVPGFVSLSKGLRNETEGYLITASQSYPQRQFVWITSREVGHDE